MNKLDLSKLITQIDQLINKQINAILHHPQVQRLEAAWRGLKLVVDQAGRDKLLKIKVLNCSDAELSKDCINAMEFDQSQLFKKIYGEEFDQAGGEPFGLLIGDYYFSHQPRAMIHDSISVLEHLSRIAAAAYCPFIAGAEASFFGLNSMTEIQPQLKLSAYFKHAEYRRWHKLRETEDARFIGLTLPRIMMRKPYNKHRSRIKNRFFIENSRLSSDYLWGNASFAYACVVINAFKESGWFANIRGVNPETLSGGVVQKLVRDDFHLSAKNETPTLSTEVYLTDGQEKQLSDLGFLPLRDNPLHQLAVFYNSQSIQSYTHLRNTLRSSTTQSNFQVNYKISSMLHYMLCTARFAHYIKVMMRDKIGSFTAPQELEAYLSRWLLSYTTANTDVSTDTKIKRPLNNASVEVKSQIGRPDQLSCVLHIKPHYQLDEVQSQLKLVLTKESRS